jgi:hypothetical protein
MADINIDKFRTTVVREGSRPASAGFVESEGQDPVDPAGSPQDHLAVTIAAGSTGLAITNSQVLSGAGTVAQYIRGDGSLADFPESSGGGSSVSYYLNGSVDQGTIGGVAYKELNKVPILGAGTDFTINADGYIASFITDAGDPNLLEIPGGNWNFETYFSSSSSGGTPTFYVELYKYDGTTFTLIASSVTSPEFIAFGTTLTPYFSTLAVPTTTLALTDRLAVRYYVTHSGRTITLHTENNHLCQIITTFTTGLTALNGLTAQVQNFAVGTTGTDFNIASAVSTHTFNLPTASATNRGALSAADWALFTQAYNDKINSAAVTGTTTKTLTLTQQDGGTITASWSDLNTDAVLSVFGRTGNVIAVSGDYTTAQVTESGNLYYTDARSRAALSFAAGSGAYNTSTGVITIPTNNNQITNGAGYITSAALAGYLPLSGGVMTGPITTPNSTFGIVIGDDSRLADRDVSNTLFVEGVQNTDRGYINFSQTTGNALGAINGGDLTWRGNAVVTGAGTTNYLPKFTGASTVGNSQIFDNGTSVGINTATPGGVFVLDVTARDTVYNTRLYQPSTLTTSYNSLLISGAMTSAIAYFGIGGSATGNTSFRDSVVIGSQSSHPLVFNTADAERMEIFTDGNVSISNSPSNAGFKLDVNGTGRFSSDLTANRYRGINSLVLNNYTTVNPSSNVYLYSPPGDRDAWIYLDSATTASNWGIYHRQIDSAVGGLPANSIGFIGGDTNTLQAWISLANGNGYYAGNLLVGNNSDNGARLQVSGEGRFYQPLTSTTSYLTVENNRARNAAVRLKTTVGDFYLGVGIGADVNQFQIYDGTAGANRLTINSTGAATFSSSVTADSLIIANNDARIRNNDATGRIILSNSTTNTFAIFYGTSHPTNANQTVFANGGVTTCTFSSTGVATFNNLAGSGNRIVVANSSGTLISAVIGSGLAFDGTTLTATGGGSGSISGSGTSGTVALFTGATSIGNSAITQSGSDITFSSGINPTKTAKNTYAIQIRGAFYGAPRLQVYDLAADPNGYMGLGTDMSGAPYELSNYFPRTSGLGKWSVGSWAGNFGTGQYVSGYNEKLFITENAAQFNVPLTVTSSVAIGTGFTPSNIFHAYSSLPRVISDTSSNFAVFNLYQAGSEKGAFYLDNSAKQIITEANGDNTYSLLFRTAGNPRMTILSGGNVGIGTITPATRFHVESASVSYGQLRFLNTLSSGETSINIGRTNQTLEQRWTIGQGVAGIGDSFGFYTGGSSRVNLQTNGNFLIGTTADNGNTLRVNGTIWSDSSITATSFFESSDATLKTLVEDNYQAQGIESVVAKLYIKNGKEEIGYFAQDLQAVLPSAVSKGSDGLLNLSYREVHTAKIAYLEEEIRQIKKRYEIN